LFVLSLNKHKVLVELGVVVKPQQAQRACVFLAVGEKNEGVKHTWSR
jgi:hypothetical protein